ncbi:outer membrane protein TolC [Mesonia hippocampi]|uniref:Outer membrane protein TolC n=1 Tax=Mesonia hippocampi TaxID=1628250 RepID=A0A840EYC8_9FLAO|nr:TolC family protein [Mesonia hippocampi]MBB4119827.1 outer membrane protein TolC [Mesonia hippocampi]
MINNFQIVTKITVGLFLIFSTTLKAQELDLKSYIDLVKNNNLDLKQANYQIKSSKEDKKIARSLWLPSVSLEGFYQRDFNKNYLFISDEFDGSITQLRTNFNNSVDFSSTITQVLYDSDVIASLKIAKLADELSLINIEQAQNEIITQASILYWQAILVKESIAVLEEDANLAKLQFNQIESVYKKGAVSKLELYQAEALYKETLPALNKAKKQYNSLLNELKTIANIDLTEEFVLVDNLESITVNVQLSVNSDKINNQPHLQSLKKEIEISEVNIKSKKRFWYPKLNLVTGYNYIGQDNRFNFNNNKNKLFFGQLRLSIPVFSGGKNKAELAKAQIEKDVIQVKFQQKKAEFLKQLHTAQIDYNSAIENIDIRKSTVALNQKEIAIYNKQLHLGVVTPIDYKEVRLRLLQSKLELLNDYLELHIASLQIKRILGTIK